MANFCKAENGKLRFFEAGIGYLVHAAEAEFRQISRRESESGSGNRFCVASFIYITLKGHFEVL